jgi:hypothetical protein
VVGGIGYGVYLKNSKPDVYDGLSADLERFNVQVGDTHARIG